MEPVPESRPAGDHRLAPSAFRLRCCALALACSVLLSLPACRLRPSHVARAPGKEHAGVSSHCNDGFSVGSGPYRYENNQWGRGKAKGSYEQCLLERERGGQRQFGWTWDWPGEEPSVYAYPEIIWGWKPWTGGRSTDARFPRRVSEVEKLAIHYRVQTEAVGSYNLAPEVWLTRRKEPSGKPGPELITTEIMFWLDYAGIARPAGAVIEELEIDGASYELWRMDDMSNGGVSWRIYSFKRKSIAREGTLNVHEFLRYMVERGQIDAKEYVASVEFGNEIVGGRGTTWVERYEIEAKP